MAYEKKEINTGVTYTSGVKNANPGKLGDHPVGGAVGAAVGAVAGSAIAGAAEGAAVSTAAGLPGMAAGVAIGAVVGALAGKGTAQIINPTTEDEYWQENYANRDYVKKGESYDTYGPAYRHGVDSYNKYQGRPYDEVEPQLRQEWETRSDKSLPWDNAEPASRDAYERLYNRNKDSVVTEEDIDRDIDR